MVQLQACLRAIGEQRGITQTELAVAVAPLS